MAQPKYTVYKYVCFKDGSWRYCRAALYANRTIRPGVVTVGGRGEKHPEGNYYLACGGEWIPAGANALTAQRQQHALLSGNALGYELYSGRPVPKAAVVQPQEPVANGRKRVKDEISKYLDDMVASKPAIGSANGDPFACRERLAKFVTEQGIALDPASRR